MFKSEMLIVSIVCATLCIVWSQETRMALYFSPESVVNFKKSGETCGNRYGVDPKDVRKIYKWTLEDDKKSKQFLYCTLLESKYISENGRLNVEEASKIVPINGTQEEARKIYEECDKTISEDVLELAYGLAACYHKNFVLLLKKPEA